MERFVVELSVNSQFCQFPNLYFNRTSTIFTWSCSTFTSFLFRYCFSITFSFHNFPQLKSGELIMTMNHSKEQATIAVKKCFYKNSRYEAIISFLGRLQIIDDTYLKFIFLLLAVFTLLCIKICNFNRLFVLFTY